MDLKQFCCQEIQIPPMLPSILKQYTKGAIRTQPRDLLVWSASYFRAMANGEVPPVKDRLEYPTGDVPSGLTIGLLRVLHKQLHQKPNLTVTEIKVKWSGLCLNEEDVDSILQLGNVDDSGYIDWLTFMTLAAKSIARNTKHTVELVCEVLTEQEDGFPASIPYSVFVGVYKYLAQLTNIPEEQVERVLFYLKETANANFDMVSPQDFHQDKCPPLE